MFLSGISIILLTLLFCGGYVIINSISDRPSRLAGLQNENKELYDKIKEMASLYEDMNKNVTELTRQNNELRIAANLQPVSEEERKLGTGGGAFYDFSSSKNSLIDVDAISNYITNLENKIKYEKQNYLEISRQLKTNEKLYASIPALKPCQGEIGAHGFGMRLHPILRITRMHEGIDIITDQGTPVFAPGNGVVEFNGYKGGLGLCIEVNHGFGYRTVYGHLSSVQVKNGQKVSRGDMLAYTGNSGLSSGPHLHYEVEHNGVKMDPENFLFDDVSVFDYRAKK